MEHKEINMEKMVRPLTAVGMKSDTSMTGVDVALIETDGIDIYWQGPWLSSPYPPELKSAIKSVMGERGQLDAPYLKHVEKQVTQHHIDALQTLLRHADKNALNVDVVAFPGHTVLHHPHDKVSIQIGSVEQLQAVLNVPVVNRFFQTDLSAGGQGSPLFPVFYEAMTRDLDKPVGVVSIGGLTSLSYIGANGELVGFDVGPGNILIDRWMDAKMGAEMDFDGLWAARGSIDQRLLTKMLAHPYFAKKPPKASDATDFDELMKDVEGSTVADGAATLTALTVQSIVRAAGFLPETPKMWIITGGGAMNPSIIKGLRQTLPGVRTAQEMRWNTECLEAQGWAFLAARTVFKLPISFPLTTGVLDPISGGLLHPRIK